MIWCVEDDASIRDIELYALRSAGLEAEGFTDGAAFWKALQSEKPDLVVLDVMLPGIDGTELLGRMRASTSLRRIPVIMATAKGAEYDRVRALDGGADGLDFYRNLAREWKNALTVGGKIFLEVGIGQADDVLRLLRAQGFGDLEITKDLNGIPRVVHGTLWGEL